MSDVKLGQIVHSRAGRDKGKYFIVVGIVDEEYVLLADGDLRKLSNPKRKKVKHLVIHNVFEETIKTRIEENIPFNDSELKKCLQSKVINN